jgi:hypothetical protein
MADTDIHTFIKNQNSNCKVTFTGKSRFDFMQDFNDFQQEALDDVLADSNYAEAKEIIARFMIAPTV